MSVPSVSTQISAPSCTGLDLSSASPIPSRPPVFLPHTHKVLSVLRAKATDPLCAEKSILNQSVSDPTCVGEDLNVISPSPSWPFVLLPHVQSVPSALTNPKCEPTALNHFLHQPIYSYH